MSNIDLAIMGIKNLLRRKARTVLTVLGVIIGTAAIVVMVSLGLGMTKAFEQQLEEYGSLTMITVQANRDYGSMMVSSSDSSSSLSSEKDKVVLDDAMIESVESMDHVKFAIGFKRFDSKFFAGRYESWSNVKAVDFNKLALMDIELSEGVLPTLEGHNEVLFGFQASKEFYDPKSRNYNGQSPEIDIFNTKIEMIPTSNYSDKRPRGYIVTPTGITSEKNWDYAWDIFMDYDTFEKIKKEFDRKNKNNNNDTNKGNSRRKSQQKENKYDEMKVNVDKIDNVQEVQEKVKALGFEAYSLTDALEQQKKSSGLMQAVLGGIGAVSLFIAAIGITNTMVMSIYERTKEIGVMKVIGAELRDIKRLFLFEAAMIGFIGGVFGVLVSFGASFLINTVLSGMNGDSGYYGPQMLSDIPVWLAISALGFSTIIGLLAGYYPAVRATRLSALEAIRTD
ncbi:ABC transporter permease [Fusibacter ferrireducens]|uniref:ABC transporter permease n=1 Tax=Fusibacter ferrireducens TaxID=2785058 RepID=A0ABR9ZQQ5_9FIRM|nr:ABC transporter permease [Fusibacter ferrireducens]MBF4692795.1 ABC transporter permease [Fusibacter ferrireducens]